MELPADGGHDGGGDRARAQRRHGFQRDQAREDGNRAWWCRCRRSSPKAKRSASTRPKAPTRNARNSTAARDLPRALPLRGKHRPQIEHQRVLFDARDDRRIARAQCRSASTASSHSARSATCGSDCSGVAPPPITDSPGSDLARLPRKARQQRLGALDGSAPRASAGSCAERECSPIAPAAGCAAWFPAPGRSSCPTRSARNSGLRRRRATISASPARMPACGPPSSLSPLNETRSGAGGEALGDERLVDSERRGGRRCSRCRGLRTPGCRARARARPVRARLGPRGEAGDAEVARMDAQQNSACGR